MHLVVVWVTGSTLKMVALQTINVSYRPHGMQCPKTAANEHGAYEDSMIDTKVKIADKPLEILKVIHSFDPCLACATHLYNKKGEKIVSVNTDALCK